MLKQVIILAASLSASLNFAHAQQIVAALKEDEAPGISAITGCHSLHDKTNSLDVRVLEMDVGEPARNPMTLFIVITDNDLGAEPQEHVWRMPDRVSVIKKVTLIKNCVKIAVIVDGQMDERTGKLPMHDEIINVAYEFAKGVLSDKIRITASHP